MALKKGSLRKVLGVGHKLGHKATRAVRAAVWGSRPEITSSASNALAHESAIGEPLHSVFEGPNIRRRGAPSVKRPRSA